MLLQTSTPLHCGNQYCNIYLFIYLTDLAASSIADSDYEYKNWNWPINYDALLWYIKYKISSTSELSAVTSIIIIISTFNFWYFKGILCKIFLNKQKTTYKFSIITYDQIKTFGLCQYFPIFMTKTCSVEYFYTVVLKIGVLHSYIITGFSGSQRSVLNERQ